VEKVTPENCFNSTQQDQNIGFQMLYTTTASPAPHNAVANIYASILVPLLLILAIVSM
jgi:hypothetical protein